MSELILRGSNDPGTYAIRASAYEELGDTERALRDYDVSRALDPEVQYSYIDIGRIHTRRGELDGTPRVVRFARMLEAAVVETIEGGIMTGDLARVCDPPVDERATSVGFIDAVRGRLEQKMSAPERDAL